jgi:CRISPR-associated protein Csx3
VSSLLLEIQKEVSRMTKLTVLEIVLKEGLLRPEDLPGLLKAVEEAVPGEALQGLVVLSGRLPVWAYGALVHELHPAAGVATFDPRLGGAVVVARHRPDLPEVGSVVSLDEAETIKVEV